MKDILKRLRDNADIIGLQNPELAKTMRDDALSIESAYRGWNNILAVLIMMLIMATIMIWKVNSTLNKSWELNDYLIENWRPETIQKQ